MFVGSWICGCVVDIYAKCTAAGPIAHDWRSIWMVPAIGSTIVLFSLLLGFKTEKTAPPQYLKASFDT